MTWQPLEIAAGGATGSSALSATQGFIIRKGGDYVGFVDRQGEVSLNRPGS